MRKKNWNNLILEVCSERPIAFIPFLAKISGSAANGLFMSQLLYWQGKGANGEWTYKTIAEMKRETMLSRSEQQNAIRSWKKFEVLDMQVRGIPPKRYFRINVEKLVTMLEEMVEVVQANRLMSQEEHGN